MNNNNLATSGAIGAGGTPWPRRIFLDDGCGEDPERQRNRIFSFYVNAS
jgi:hypothetical protein